jgi:hypothetical protein
VRYENTTLDDFQKRVERMREANARPFPVPGRFSNDYEGDDFSRTHFICLDQGFSWSPMLHVNCFSRDGRWSVSMLGLQQTRPEFEMILRGVASMGTPSK